jgi:hypothetical protein
MMVARSHRSVGREEREFFGDPVPRQFHRRGIQPIGHLPSSFGDHVPAEYVGRVEDVQGPVPVD